VDAAVLILVSPSKGGFVLPVELVDKTVQPAANPIASAVPHAASLFLPRSVGCIAHENASGMS
jgi:hypothetical protein